ncbi:MAG: RecQ family ATP-dependent DNA helicase, partial [Bacillota bacterium]
MTPKEALNKYFGHKDFRHGQKEIIESIMCGENILAVLPTGGGKSVCYQVPAILSDRFSIVISPLIALMKDQVDSLNKVERVAAFINSTVDFREAEEIFASINSGQIKLLYLAPEKLETISFADKIKNLSPSYLFVDEAHCISEWGHNFRPSYRKIKDFCDYISVRNISAFTATATPEVIKDIVQQLGMKNPRVFVKGFERNNLTVRVIKTKKKKLECFDLLSHYKTPAIIYTASRKRAEEISEFLNLYKMNAAYYHAGLSAEERKYIQESFQQDKIKIIAATNAFGMGIDKKDIRLIIHYNMPGSIENYYQEIGRAGRDGNEAFAFLLYDDSDKQIHNYFISNSLPDKDLIINIYNAICDYGKIAVGSRSDKEIALNSSYISLYVKREVPKALLSSVISTLEQAGYLKSISEYEKKYYFQFNLPAEKLKDYVKKTNDMARDIILLLLREYGNMIINTRTLISIEKLASGYGVSEKYIEDELTLLENMGIAEYSCPPAGNTVKLIGTRVKEQYLTFDYKKVMQNYENALSKLDSMVEYAYSGSCRIKYIINYFGQDDHEYKCGKCDNCMENLNINSAISDYLSEIIIKTVSESSIGISEKKLYDILMGKAEDESRLIYSSFGCCTSYTQNEIKSILELLLSTKLLQKEEKKQRRLILTEKGFDFIKNKEIEFFKPEGSPAESFESNLELFNLLKEARQATANRFQQSGSLICPDEILRMISELKPQSPAQLLSVKGFTQKMFNKFGEEIILVINEYLQSKNSAAQPQSEKKLPANISETYKLLKKGYKLPDIASLRKLSEAVISMQVETILEYFPETEISELFDNSDLNDIIQQIRKGYTDLKDLKSRLPENISYPQIRIAV